MLSNVHVKNFALIDEADIGLSDNLNILTGETGAGKSILLGAINLALGARTSKDVVKAGADYALAELTFTETCDAVKSRLKELGIDEEDELVISRKLLSSGKSIIRINGETMNTAAARSVTSLLIDIYGQNEHQSLLDPDNQRDIVDRFIGAEADRLKSLIHEEYKNYSSIKREAEQIENDPRKRAREIDRLQSEINEIEAAELKEGEEEELKAERRRLANAALIYEALGTAVDCLYRDGGCSDQLSAAIKALSRVSEFDGNLEGFLDELGNIDSAVSDIYRELDNYLDELPSGTERLEEVDMRLDLISRLKSKFGNSVEAIEAFLKENRIKLDRLNEFESYVEELETRLNEAVSKLTACSEALSGLRAAAAQELKIRIMDALAQLNFNKVNFDIVFTRREELHSDGIDTVEFVISLNPGEEPKPLARIASGGEMSRIMLAIKSVFAGRETIDTLIFDEIDAGISGITAQKVADKLCTISGERQVICITHLPQIAAMADTHFKVEKSADTETTLVSVRRMDESGMINEIARIMGGENPSQSVIDAAKDVKLACDGRKPSLRG